MRLLPGLTLKNLPFELLSGLTLLALAVPLNIGYAQIAGLPAIAGLYSLIVPSIAFALLASSRQLIVSPDAAASALVASSLTGLAAVGSEDYVAMALAQAIVGGLMFFVCAFFKLGFLANFLSEPILIGFVGGLALDILVSQVAKMLGIHIDSGAEFIEKVVQLISGLGTTNLPSLLIALGSIAILVVGRRFARRVPWALVVLILTTVVVVVAGLENYGVDVLGEVQAGPPKLTWPDLSFAQWVQIIPSAAALTLVAMAEGLLVAKSYAQTREYPIHPNRDLFAFGAANIGAGLTGGFTIGASTSRTAALDSSGSRTQLPALVAAVGTLLLLLFGTALLTDIPSAAIGAIVAVAIFGLLGFVELAAIFRVSRVEFVVGLTCFVGTLLLGPIIGIIIAFVLSLINLALRASKPPIDVLAQSEGEVQALIEAKSGVVLTAPGVVIVRFAAPLFFANAVAFDEAVREAVEAARPLGLKHVVLDFEAVTDIDVTGAGSLTELRAWLKEQRFSVDYARVRPDILKLFAVYDLRGDSRIFPSNRDAVAALANGAPDPAP